MKDIFKGVIIKILTVVVIIGMIGGLGFWGYCHFISDNIPSFTTTSEKNIEVIKEKLEITAELNTGSYLCTDVLTKSSSIKIEKWDWNIPLTEKSFIISYDGIVKAGIKDLSKAEVYVKGDFIVVKLPAVEITGIEIDNDSFEVLEQNNNLFNPIQLEDLNEAQKVLKEEMKKCAIEKGVLDLAKSNAETILSSILSDYPNISFQWKE